jgi:hypothetical protein
MVDCLSEEWTDGWQRTEILFQEEHPGGKEGIMIKTRVDLLSIVIIMMLGICSLLGILSMVLMPIQADRKLMELPDRELPDIMTIA